MRTSTLALLSGVALTRADFLAPAGGETLEVDKEVTIQWKTEDLVEALDTSLVPANGDTGADEAQEIASGISNSGSVTFTPGVETGDFELVLTDSEDNTVISDAFSIGDAGAAAGDDEDEGEGGESNGDDAEDEEAEVRDGENEDANEVAESLNPDTGGAVAGDTGGDDSNARDSSSPPGSFIPLSGDQLTIFPTLSNDDGADAPTQPTEEAIETSTVDGGVQTASDELSETERAEPTAVSSLSDGLAVSTSAADVDSEITSAVIGDVFQTEELELEPASFTAVTTDAVVGVNPIGSPGGEVTSTGSDEASLDDDADTSTNIALTSDATQGLSATDSAISDDSLVATSDSLLSASIADTLSSSSTGDILISSATDDTLISASDLTDTGSDIETQTATSDNAFPSLDDEVSTTLTNKDGTPISSALSSLSDDVSATLQDEDGSPVSRTAISTTTSNIPTSVSSDDSDGSNSDDPGTETDSEASGVSGPTTFATDIIGTGTIADGAAEATVSQAGVNAEETEDPPGGSARKMSGMSAMLGFVVLVSIWMF